MYKVFSKHSWYLSKWNCNMLFKSKLKPNSWWLSLLHKGLIKKEVKLAELGWCGKLDLEQSPSLALGSLVQLQVNFQLGTSSSSSHRTPRGSVERAVLCRVLSHAQQQSSGWNVPPGSLFVQELLHRSWCWNQALAPCTTSESNVLLLKWWQQHESPHWSFERESQTKQGPAAEAKVYWGHPFSTGPCFPWHSSCSRGHGQSQALGLHFTALIYRISKACD